MVQSFRNYSMEKLQSFAVIKKEIFPIFPIQRNKTCCLHFTNCVVGGLEVRYLKTVVLKNFADKHVSLFQVIRI
jgi:hypothetical protein